MPYVAGIARWSELARGLMTGDRDGLLKLLVSTEDRRILGVHVIGTGATDLVHIGQAVMGGEGAIDFLVTAVFNYPTFAESYKVAALDAENRIKAMESFNARRRIRPASAAGRRELHRRLVVAAGSRSRPARRLAAARAASSASAAARASISSDACAGGASAWLCSRRTPSAKRAVSVDRACENSDGITKTLFALPCASCGSICRYW